MPAHRRGLVNDQMVLSIDLAPTILAAAGIDVPVAMQVRDLAQLYLTPDDNDHLHWRQDFFYEWNQGSPVDVEGHGDPLVKAAVFALISMCTGLRPIVSKSFTWPRIHRNSRMCLT